jgi:hypothetical protein
MLQETANERQYRHGGETPVAGARRPVTKRDGRQTAIWVIIQRDNAAVGDGDAKDVRGQIAQCPLSTADPLAVDDPGFTPDVRRDLVPKVGLAQGVTDFGAKDRREQRNLLFLLALFHIWRTAAQVDNPHKQRAD